MTNVNIEPAVVYTPGSSITVAFPNEAPRTIYTGSPNFKAVVEATKAKQWTKVRSLTDVGKAVTSISKGRAKVVDGVVYLDGTPMHNVLTNRIIAMLGEGFDVKPMLAFLENLEKNPSMVAREELYLFLEANEIPLTTDGHFLAYKKVRKDYMDHYTGTFRNKVGDVCQMDRSQVDDNRDRTCSKGLHFASYSYLRHYASDGASRVMIVKINPADVVSIPSDYNNAKGRCWKYLVVQEHENFTEGEWFRHSVYSDTGEVVAEDDRYDNNDEYYDGRYDDVAAYHNVRDAFGRFAKNVRTW